MIAPAKPPPVPHYKHCYDEDSYDDEGNRLGKVTVYCVDGKLAVDFDRQPWPDGEVVPQWFRIINTDESAPCRICSGEVKPGYAPPKRVRVSMPYEVGRTVLDYMGSGVRGWDHDNENACQSDSELRRSCALCMVEDWLDIVLRPALRDRPVRGKRK